MLGDDLEVVEGAAVGAWIEPRLGGEWGAVTQQVPTGFEAYVRLFHAPVDGEGKLVTWAEVARRLGRTAHREMQWHQIVGSSDSSNFTGSKWTGSNPLLGQLGLEELEPLCDLLAVHTADPDRCFFALCEINNGPLVARIAPGEPRPLLKLPMGRDHLVVGGPLAAATQIPHLDSWEPAPGLIWPADRCWFVVSEVDFDSTLIGGSRALVDALVAAPDLEVYEVEPETLLTAFSDQLNPVPEPDEE